MDHSLVQSSIVRSSRRLNVDALDLVQFHWWDYRIPGYIEAAQSLQKLKDEGLIKHIGLTNFDTQHMTEIIEAGVTIVSNQVQYSTLDRRPSFGLAKVAEKNNVSLLCYGAIAGGFLTDKWLNRKPGVNNDRSETKYRLIIEEFGGWELYQELLQALRDIADDHKTDIASISIAWVLSQKNVAAVISSMRSTKHAVSNLNAFDIQLSKSQINNINELLAKSPWNHGEVYDVERDQTGQHGSIMKYNLGG